MDGMVGNFSSTPPAPRIGGAPLEELPKKGGVSGVELAGCLNIFSCSGAKFDGAELSQTPAM